jgi:hypothetical protein
MIPVVQAGLSAVRCWRIIIVWIGITLIPSAVVSVPAGRLLSAELDHSVHASSWARTLDVSVVGDLILNAGKSVPVLEGALVISLLLTVVFWPFLTGMVVASAKETRSLGFVALVQGGVREYGRMLRMLLWSVVPLGIAGAIGGWALHVVNKRADAAILASQVAREHLLAVIALTALLIAAHVTVEAGRAQFSVDIHRRSAVKAWWRGLRLVFARPVAALGSYLLITAVGVILVALFVIARINSPQATFSGLLTSLALTELIAVAAIWMRIARLMALIQIARWN